MKLRYALLGVALIAMPATTSFSQTMTAAADNAITNELRQEGVKYETKRTVLWVEKDSLTQEEIKEFGALVNQGIIDIEKYSGVKFDINFYQTDKIEYFISSKVMIAHGSMGAPKPFIYLPAAKVKAKTIPYLHETTHIIVWKSQQSLWLQEGFASQVQTFVSKHYGGYAGNTFNPENTDIDQLAREILKSEPGKKVLPLIGQNGTPLTLRGKEQAKIYAPIMADRKVAAPAFYNLSESFVNFLVKKVGMKKMRKVFEAQDTRAGIEEVTGKSVDEWKAEWLKSLGA